MERKSPEAGGKTPTAPAVMSRGVLLVADLSPTQGHEQSGRRPCVVVSDTVVAQHQRFPQLIVVPLTSTLLSGPLYPMLQPGAHSGVTLPSCVLVDQLRSIDKGRVLRVLGRLQAAEMAAVDKALRALLGL